jgi:hypothetical protein
MNASIDTNQINTTSAPQIAVRLYENQKLGKSFGPAKFHNAIYNATADVVSPNQKYLLDYILFDDWAKTARTTEQLELRNDLANDIKAAGIAFDQVLASWIKRYDHTGQKIIVYGYSSLDLVTNELYTAIADPDRTIVSDWRLEVRPCRIKYGQKSPQLLATNYDLI